jgi:predicted bacteriocin transport accessory protein
MKKILIFLSSLVLLMSLVGCSSNKTYEEISYNKLNDMLDKKESFILFIGSNTCSACSVYKGTLNDVISEYNVDVKYIDLSKLSDTQKSELSSVFPITGTPTTVFITNGVEKDTYNRIVGSVKKSEIIQAFKENKYIKG